MNSKEDNLHIMQIISPHVRQLCDACEVDLSRFSLFVDYDIHDSEDPAGFSLQSMSAYIKYDKQVVCSVYSVQPGLYAFVCMMNAVHGETDTFANAVLSAVCAYIKYLKERSYGAF